MQYACRYSNAMWHVDWHLIKDSHLKRLNLIVFLDDVSRCVTGASVFQNATSENAASMLRQAISQYTMHLSRCSDNGSALQEESLDVRKDDGCSPRLKRNVANNIVPITAKTYRPQTNGNLKRFFGTLESEFVHFDSVEEFMEFYNEQRTHFSLDIRNGQTPLMAPHSKKDARRDQKEQPYGWKRMSMTSGINFYIIHSRTETIKDI